MDPSVEAQLRQRTAQRRNAMLLLLAGLFALLAVATWQILAMAGAGLWPSPESGQAYKGFKPTRIMKVTPQTDPEKLTVSDQSILEPLSVTDAEKANLAIPVARKANPAARPLMLPYGNPVSWSRSVDCLTAAIYYEANSEPVDGQRAVAQVVLNRVRHPAFPHTVCGVVFQGSERKTGCQFSFTCDGSLARLPQRSGWERARTIAAAALTGSVYRPVGWATHYHADYVVPNWAYSLTKSGPIGRHIFYRWPGGWGTPKAFTASYTGSEPMPSWLIAQASWINGTRTAEMNGKAEAPVLQVIVPPIDMTPASPAPAAVAAAAPPASSRRLIESAATDGPQPTAPTRALRPLMPSQPISRATAVGPVTH